MLKHSTWAHLRIPFSIFLLPVYLFALSISYPSDFFKPLLIFVILHFLLYPASNGYNSFFDKDEKSIGGLKNPPKVSLELYYVSLVLDMLAIGLGLLISWEFSLMVVIYGLVSKAYSHPAIRLKKMPYTGWFVAGAFQGFFTFIMVYIGINQLSFVEVIYNEKALMAAVLTTLLLWGSYPMTQVYQHQEDARRGDNTLSLRLGVLGTFHFTGIVFAIANLGFFIFYSYYYELAYALAFQFFLIPMLIYFLMWYRKVRQDASAADFDSTMRLNRISAISLNAFFLGVFMWSVFL